MAMFMTAPARAAEPRFHLGVSAGSTTADVSEKDVRGVVEEAFSNDGYSRPTNVQSSLDDRDDVWSVLAGYRLSPKVWIEAEYIDLGTLVYQSSGTARVGNLFPLSGPLPATAEMHIETSVLMVKALVRWPLGKAFDVHAQGGLGVSRTHLQVMGLVAGGPRGVDDRHDYDNVCGLFGAGAAFHVGEHWRVSLDWMRFDSTEGDSTLEVSTTHDTVTLGISVAL